jgi:hypothetical protein
VVVRPVAGGVVSGTIYRSDIQTGRYGTHSLTGFSLATYSHQSITTHHHRPIMSILKKDEIA